MKTLGQDLRYALRMLLNSPGFTAAAILSLALGIGACTTIFSVFNAILLHSFPVKDPGRLVVLFEHEPIAVAANTNTRSRPASAG